MKPRGEFERENSYSGNLETRARNRSDMGRSSSGAFDARASSAYSSSGRAEPFATDVSDHPRRTTIDDPLSYSNSFRHRSYLNNQRSWSTEQDQWRSSSNNRRSWSTGRGQGTEAGYGFCVVFAFFAFFLSLWMLFGLYGNQELEMGMFYSRVVNANSLFVKEIKVQNLRDIGPVAYSFSTRPELASPVPEKRIQHIAIERRHHQRHIYWLNKGSYIEISCTLEDSEPGTDSLIVAIVKGEDGFQNWKGDPANPDSALRWKRIRDKGSLSLTVKEADDYSIVFGNLNNRKMTLSINREFRHALHSGKNAKFEWSSQLTDTYKFPVALGRPTYVLLKSPVVNQHGVDEWKVKVSYVPRWITYILLWGMVAAGLLSTRASELRQASSQAPTTQEHAPLVADDAAHHPGQTPSAPVDPFMQADAANNRRAGLSEDQLCTICLDAPKDCFFDPCGHRCTCYSCGMKIQRGDSNRCPMCRQTIRTVRRIYDA